MICSVRHFRGGVGGGRVWRWLKNSVAKGLGWGDKIQDCGRESKSDHQQPAPKLPETMQPSARHVHFLKMESEPNPSAEVRLAHQEVYSLPRVRRLTLYFPSLGQASQTATEPTGRTRLAGKVGR